MPGRKNELRGFDTDYFIQQVINSDKDHPVGYNIPLPPSILTRVKGESTATNLKVVLKIRF